MCSDCLGRYKEIETCAPEDELWELYRAAYEQYQSNVLNGDQLYDRYVKDFISYHLPCFYREKEAIMLHSKNINNMYELLTDRLDLVESFFVKNHFTEKDYQDMHRLFNTSVKVSAKKAILGLFDAEEISLITRTANEANLFDHIVTEDEIEQLMSCTLPVPLQVTSNRRFALFFDAIRSGGRIIFSWQKKIENNKLIASSETRQPITSNGIASALTQAKAHPDGFESICSTFAKKLKEMKRK